MPSLARRPAAQHERERLQARRLRAAELFALGVRQAEVARRLGVPPGREHLARPLASRRHRCAAQPRTDRPGAQAVRHQLGQIEHALLQGAQANGFVGELWTLDRIALVIERLTGVRHHPAHVSALLQPRLGWSVQRPMRRATERDQGAIDRWVKERWPKIKQTVSVWACGPGGSLSGSGRRHRGMTPKQTGTEVAFGRAVCRGAGVDLAHRLLA